MTKIWLVSHGEYSDYSIDAAFSTEEKAKSFAKTMNGQEDDGNYGVEEYEVDKAPEYPPGLSPFVVTYHERNGDFRNPTAPYWYAFVGANWGADIVRPRTEMNGHWGVTATFSCLARNREHAIKIGQERFQKLTAQAAVDRGEL